MAVKRVGFSIPWLAIQAFASSTSARPSFLRGVHRVMAHGGAKENISNGLESFRRADPGVSPHAYHFSDRRDRGTDKVDVGHRRRGRFLHFPSLTLGGEEERRRVGDGFAPPHALPLNCCKSSRTCCTCIK